MKLKINFKKIACITALTLCLTGCGNKENSKKKNDSPTQTESTTQIASTYIEETSYIEQPTSKAEIETTEFVESNDDTISNYFKQAKEELNKYIESEEWENVKLRGKEIITTGIDFVFFDQPIKGVYFDELTAEGKRLALLNINSTLELIEEFEPGFTSNMSEKYQNATLFLEEKYLNVLEKIKEYLGEENYEAIGDIKDQIKGDISDKTEEIGSSLKKKYQEWKNK